MVTRCTRQNRFEVPRYQNTNLCTAPTLPPLPRFEESWKFTSLEGRTERLESDVSELKTWKWECDGIAPLKVLWGVVFSVTVVLAIVLAVAH